jgi:hypothetical protein
MDFETHKLDRWTPLEICGTAFLYVLRSLTLFVNPRPWLVKTSTETRVVREGRIKSR